MNRTSANRRPPIYIRKGRNIIRGDARGVGGEGALRASVKLSLDRDLKYNSVK